MMKNYFIVYVFLSVFVLLACNPQPEIDDVTMLDGTQIFDASLAQPEKYLVSSYIANPTDLQKDTPVIICAHGFSASTFEWDELRMYANVKKTFYVSQVLLGGHGRSYTDFKSAGWADWQQSIKSEYELLVDKGFKNIYLAGSSTGGPLLVEMLSSGYFNSRQSPKGIFLIDPIVVSSNKTLTLVGLLGPVLGYTTTELETGEAGKWYVYRPQEALKQLMNLIDLSRKKLEKGVFLPQNVWMKVYHSNGDKTADPVSSVMIFKGIKTSTGKNIEIEIVKSDLHVFTRLQGRTIILNEQRKLQQKTFAEFEAKMIEGLQ